jgi:hypothetical protein
MINLLDITTKCTNATGGNKDNPNTNKHATAAAHFSAAG